MRFLALCDPYGSEEAAVAAIAGGRPSLAGVIKLEISYLTLYNRECEETRWSFA